MNKISNYNNKTKTGKPTTSSAYSSNFNRNANSNLKGSHVKPKNPCSGCGGLHWKRDCPYKDSECFNCNGKGHIKKVCRVKNPKSGPTHRIESNDASLLSSYDYVFSINDSRVPPIILDMKIENSCLKMELDTGAARSLISNDTYKSLWPSSGLNKQ